MKVTQVITRVSRLRDHPAPPIVHRSHSCHPNCFVAWSATIGGRQTIHVLRDVPCGEELTISYAAGAEASTRESRRALLRRKYRFDCDCEACRFNGAALERSDARHSRLCQIHQGLSDWPDDGLVAVVEECYQLMLEEGVPLILGKAGWILAIVQLLQHGKAEGAAKWSAIGVECARIALGEDSSAHIQFSTLLQNVSKYSSLK